MAAVAPAVPHYSLLQALSDPLPPLLLPPDPTYRTSSTARSGHRLRPTEIEAWSNFVPEMTRAMDQVELVLAAVPPPTLPTWPVEHETYVVAHEHGVVARFVLIL